MNGYTQIVAISIAVAHDSSGMHLSQSKYVTEILDRASMVTRKFGTTPIDTSHKLVATAGTPMADLTK
jgi:hypothetical protein